MWSDLLWTERLFYWEPRNTTDTSIHRYHLDKSAMLGHSINLEYCMQLQYINILSTTSRYICLKNMPLCTASKTVLSGSPSSSFLLLICTCFIYFFLPTLHFSFLDSALPTTLFPFFPVPLPFGTAPNRILSFVLLTSPCHILVCYEPHISSLSIHL